MATSSDVSTQPARELRELVAFRMTRSEKAELRILADAAGVTLSEAVRKGAALWLRLALAESLLESREEPKAA
jgi:hypothetical protein